MASNDWCLLESDPSVFTELIEEFGIQDVEVQEVWDMSQETISKLRPVYGFIFLFKYQKDTRENLTILDEVPGLFYAKQVITNACGTQALLSILMNNEDRITLDGPLKEFKAFTTGFDPATIGSALANAEDIKKAHNSFRRQDPFQIVATQNDEKEDAYHFISYVSNGGVLYELDGLQPGPILHGECVVEEFTEKAIPVIQERMNTYQASEINFTLLAVTKKLKVRYEEEKAALENEEQNEATARQIEELKDRIIDETEKLKNYREQNLRRKHNYVPFICELLKKIARTGLLPELVEVAQERKKEKVAAASERKQGTKKAAAVEK